MLVHAGFNYHSDELSTEDKITLYAVEGYLDFKVCWLHVLKELSLSLSLSLSHTHTHTVSLEYPYYNNYHNNMLVICRLVRYGMKWQGS